MIGRLSGIVLEKSPPQLVIDVHGVGYEVDVPMSTFYDLPATGQSVTLLTQQIVREDAHLLYGFLTHDEREAFRQLLKISGVGPRIALAVLSGMSVADLSRSVAMQETAALTRIPGIGKKTAERLLLELKGRLADALPSAGGTSVHEDGAADVLRALLALGYSDKEANAAVKALPAGSGVSDGIKQALKALARA